MDEENESKSEALEYEEGSFMKDTQIDASKYDRHKKEGRCSCACN